VAKKMLRENQQRNSSGVPLGTKKKKRKKESATLRKPLVGAVTRMHIKTALWEEK
jgi:hypothetical protein